MSVRTIRVYLTNLPWFKHVDGKHANELISGFAEFAEFPDVEVVEYTYALAGLGTYL